MFTIALLKENAKSRVHKITAKPVLTNGSKTWIVQRGSYKFGIIGKKNFLTDNRYHMGGWRISSDTAENYKIYGSHR